MSKHNKGRPVVLPQGKPSTYTPPAAPAPQAVVEPNPYESLEDPAVTALKEGVSLEEIEMMLMERPVKEAKLPINQRDPKTFSNTVKEVREVSEDLEDEAPLITNAVAKVKSPEWTSESSKGSVREAAPLTRGTTLPQNPLREDADPMLVRCLGTLEKLMCGGVIMPWAMAACDEVSTLISDLRKAVSV